MVRHVLSILVENHSGVLSRVTGLFSRRCYNIDSLSVGETEDGAYSRITVVLHGDTYIIDQIQKQLAKLVEVVSVKVLLPAASVYRELALIKVAALPAVRAEVVGIVDIFRANIIDVSPETITVEMTGDQTKIAAFSALMEPYGIKEIARTGLTALQRGASNIRETKLEEEM